MALSERLSAVLLISAACLPGVSYAQNDGTATPAASANAGEAIVVTAQRRRENVQKVPVAVSAIGGDKLDKQGIVGFGELTAKVPALRFGTGVTGGENVVTLRGIGSQNTTSGGDSPVAYNVDGVYMARSTAVDPEFYDINRIEVLRGPQGTLYGRNSVGGSVNIITNKPTDTFSGSIDGMVGNYGAWSARGWVNVPLTDDSAGVQVAARLTGVYTKHDPYQRNVSNLPTATHDSDAQDYGLLRGQVLFTFSPKAELLLSASYNHNLAPVATKLAWGEIPTLSRARFAGQVYDPDPRVSASGYPDTFSQSGEVYSGTLNWDLGFGTLTAISAYTRGKWRQTNDADSTPLDIAHLNYWTLNSRQFSQEVRLASDDNQAFRWIVGGFYFNEKVNQGFQYVDTGLNAPLGTAFIFTNGGDIETTSWAGFAQVDYDLGKTSMNVPLTITLGVRYTHDTKHVADFLNYQVTDFGLSFPQSKEVEPSWNKTTGKFGLAYQASDNVLLYANVSSGYLSGGELVGNFPGIYGPETVVNYEAGIKSSFAEGRVTLNAALYHMKIEDMQVFVQDITGSRIDNAGKAHVTGFEAEGVAYLTDAFRVNAAVAFMQAEYDEYRTFDNRQPQTPPVLSDFSGKRLVQTPKYTVSLGAEYNIDTSFGRITPRADLFWSGDLYFLSANTVRERQDAYMLANLSLSWTDPDNRYSVMAFVRNVGDEDVKSNDGLQANTIGLGFGPDNFTYYPPRTYGIRLGINF